jgi:hypothetical protein
MEEVRQLVRSLKGSMRMSIEGPQLLEPTSLGLHHIPRAQVHAMEGEMCGRVCACMCVCV